MSESSSADNFDELTVAHVALEGLNHQAMTNPRQKQSMMDAHDHSADDCDDYCMNCTSHCSGTAIISSSITVLEHSCEFNIVVSSDTLNRTYLLFRPPIRV